MDNAKASFMDAALEEARAAEARGEVPVGAVLVRNGSVIARNGNRTRELNDPTAHAEMLVIREAANGFKSERLADCDLFVTLEPCAMCAGAISFARLGRLYFAASDPKSGGVEHGARVFSQSTCHHAPEVYSGINDAESSVILKRFFQKRRAQSQGI